MRRKTNKSRPPAPENWATSKKCDRTIERAEIAARKKIMGGMYPQKNVESPKHEVVEDASRYVPASEWGKPSRKNETRSYRPGIEGLEYYSNQGRAQ